MRRPRRLMQRNRASRTSSAALARRPRSCCGSHKAPRTARPQRERSNHPGCHSSSRCTVPPVPPARQVPRWERRGSCRMARCQTRGGDVQATRRTYLPLCHCIARST
eukprot:scaffold104545_cov69-Phaeocystis_antarctica.AAC.5